jgi:acyl dehydratase
MAPTTKFAHELEPGDEYAPLEFSVSAEMNQQFLFAQEDFDRRYIDATTGSPPLVHPAILLQMAANTKSPSFKLAPGAGSILSEAATEFLRPVAIGTRLTVQWRVTERYEKRGRQYCVMVAEIADDQGAAVLRRTLHLTFPRQASP